MRRVIHDIIRRVLVQRLAQQRRWRSQAAQEADANNAQPCLNKSRRRKALQQARVLEDIFCRGACESIEEEGDDLAGSGGGGVAASAAATSTTGTSPRRWINEEPEGALTAPSRQSELPPLKPQGLKESGQSWHSRGAVEAGRATEREAVEAGRAA